MKIIIRLTLAVAFFATVIFLEVFWNFGGSIGNLKEVITYIPVELRICIYMVFAGLIYRFADNFV